MKKVFSLAMLVITLLAFSGCDGFKAPPSIMADNSVEIFSTSSANVFNKYGFEAAQLLLNPDSSGHIYFFIRNSTVEEKRNSIDTAIDEINKKAYTEGNYQAGYRLVWVRDKNITQEGDDVAVIVEFKDINYFKGDVKLQSLGEYLADNPDVTVNNNFIDALSRKKTSIVNIEDREGYKVLTLKSVPNQIPVKLAGSSIYAYYLDGGGEGDVVEVSRDTIKTSQANYKVLVKPAQTSKILMIIAILFGASFAVTLTIKLIIDNNRRKRKTIEIYRHTSKSK